MYVCIYVCIIYTSSEIYIGTHTHIYEEYIYIYVCMNVCMCVCVLYIPPVCPERVVTS